MLNASQGWQLRTVLNCLLKRVVPCLFVMHLFWLLAGVRRSVCLVRATRCWIFSNAASRRLCVRV